MDSIQEFVPARTASSIFIFDHIHVSQVPVERPEHVLWVVIHGSDLLPGLDVPDCHHCHDNTQHWVGGEHCVFGIGPWAVVHLKK